MHGPRSRANAYASSLASVTFVMQAWNVKSPWSLWKIMPRRFALCNRTRKPIRMCCFLFFFDETLSSRWIGERSDPWRAVSFHADEGRFRSGGSKTYWEGTGERFLPPFRRIGLLFRCFCCGKRWEKKRRERIRVICCGDFDDCTRLCFTVSWKWVVEALEAWCLWKSSNNWAFSVCRQCSVWVINFSGRGCEMFISVRFLVCFSSVRFTNVVQFASKLGLLDSCAVLDSYRMKFSE